MRLEFAFNPRKIGLILGVLSVYFALQSLIAEYLIENVLDNDLYRSLVLTIDLFSVNAEQTIPTWYATLLLFMAAVVLALIATAKRAGQDRYWRYWIGLAVIFLYLSMDEGAVIHEILADGLQNMLPLTGFLTFGWQIVAVPLVILFALLYLRFWLHLPRLTRNLFILAGLLYVGGALIVEGISANQLFVEGEITFNYLAIATIEEFGEMLGVVIFIYALLAYAIEMQYSFAFSSHPIVQAASNSISKTPLFTKRLLMVVAGGVIGLNIVLIAWAFTTIPAVNLPTQNSELLVEAIIDQIVTNDVLKTRLVGTFSTDNLAARQLAKALLEIYDNVMIITTPSSFSSIALAADTLPFDRDTLSNLLSEHGETQFIIFDTHAVQLIVGSL